MAVDPPPLKPDDAENTDSELTNSLFASYVPHDLKYNADFEDSLIALILNTPTTTAAATTNDSNTFTATAATTTISDPPKPGLRIIPSDSSETPTPGLSIRVESLNPHSLPTIPEHELPLPLTDPRRIYASPIPGINLTHPGGYLEGGPGLDPDMDTFPEDFLANHPDITTGVELRAKIEEEIERAKELLRERLESRRAAREKNEGVRRELRRLAEEHEMEVRVHGRLAEEQAKRRELRERRRREREGGG